MIRRSIPICSKVEPAWFTSLRSGANQLAPASQWYQHGLRWTDLTTDLIHHRTGMKIGKKNAVLLPAEQLLCALPTLDNTHFKDKPSLDRFVGSTVIPMADTLFKKQLHQLKISHQVAFAKYGIGSPQEITAEKARDHEVGLRGMAIVQVTTLLERLANFERDRAKVIANVPSVSEAERFVPLATYALAQVCGLDVNQLAPGPFKITVEKIGFKFGGLDLSASPDKFMIRNMSDSSDLVIIFEGTTMSETAVAQIFAELLLCLHHHRSSKQPPKRVYAVRVFDTYGSLFSLEANKQQIKNFCDDPANQWNASKMEFRSSVPHPWSAKKSEAGLDLLIPSQRSKFIQMMANLRASMLSRGPRTSLMP